MLIFILILLSPASGSVIQAGSRSIDYFYESTNSIEVILEETLKTSESSYPLTGSKEGKIRLENMSPFLILTAGILAGFNPCLLAVMAFLASVTLAQQVGKKEMIKITLGFSAGIFTMYMLAGAKHFGYC